MAAISSSPSSHPRLRRLSAGWSISPETHPIFPLLRLCRISGELEQIHAFAVKTGLFHALPVSSRILTLYCDPELGSLGFARSVFDQIPQPNSFAWNSLLKRLVDEKRSHDAILLFQQMLTVSSVLPDNYNVPCAVKACAHIHAFEEGKQLHGLTVKTRLGDDSFVRSSLLSFYSKCSHLELAKKVFDHVCDKDLATRNSLIDGYVKSGNIEAARKMFEEMPKWDLFSWNLMITGYSIRGELEVAWEFFERMPEKNVVSWNAMIGGFTKNGDFGSARRLFDEMPYKNMVTWNTLITGYQKLGFYEEALKVFDEIFTKGFTPNTITLVSSLSAISEIALVERGRSVHMYIRKNGLSLEGILGTCIIEMYSKCGEIDSAFSTFKEIRRKKLGHWSAMIMGFGMHGMAKEAIDLFIKMKERGLKPDYITFTGLLNGFSKAGMVDDGLQNFELMSKEYGIEPTVEHYTYMVDLLSRVGHLEEAKKLVYHMPMRPKKMIWMSLLSCCRRYGEIELGDLAAKSLVEFDPDSTAAYLLLYNLYAAAGLWGKVLNPRDPIMERRARKKTESNSIEFNGSVHGFVISDHSRFKTGETNVKLEMRVRLNSAGFVQAYSRN
ncbi:Pentatricopeptide repeat-containing protein [Apostasia shenzhenica]|uniref:Pentatricopeptide repeat-containing protein n=1 Tax=Apostasia shenzhenica TaxID=1088818 RepID=A0A2I0ADK2_9ASPA|nr:Pentatricopeptide repeat-containing protein [Apostasia shenzhenica]